MPRWLARMVGAGLVAGLLTTPALALDPFEQARWQIAANKARITLLVPETPGYALQRISSRSLQCGGDTLGDAFATWTGPEGRTLELGQGRPFACGDGPETTLIAELVVSGRPASYGSYESDAGTVWTLYFERDGATLLLYANFDDRAGLVALAEGAVPIAPSPGQELRFTELAGQVVKTVGADTVVVNTGSRREVVRLAGIRAPRPARGGRAPGCRLKPARTLLRRAVPRGAAVVVETDPLQRARDAQGRLIGYVTRRSRARYPVGALTANYRLITTGAARVAPGRFRYRGLFASAERLARRDDRGIFGTLCNGSLAPPKHPKPKRPIVQPEPVRPQPPSGPGRVRSDAYNCDDFPLSDGTTAQQYLNRFPDDPSGLDGDGDDVACE